MKILPDRLTTKSNEWTSKYSHIWSQDKLIRDYANQFVLELTQEIDDLERPKIGVYIETKNRNFRLVKFKEEFYAIRQEFQEFDRQLSTSLVTQFNNLANSKKSGWNWYRWKRYRFINQSRYWRVLAVFWAV